MNFTVFEGVICFFLFIHCCIAFMLTIDLNERFFVSNFNKFMWYSFVWLVPFIGEFAAYKYFKIGWAKGNDHGNDGGFGGADGQ